MQAAPPTLGGMFECAATQKKKGKKHKQQKTRPYTSSDGRQATAAWTDIIAVPLPLSPHSSQQYLGNLGLAEASRSNSPPNDNTQHQHQHWQK